MYRFLIVIDMQNDFIDGALGTPEAEAIVPNVQQKINSRQFNQILITLDEHELYSYENTIEGNFIPPHCIVNARKETYGDIINPLICSALAHSKEFNEDNIFYKNTFCSLELGERLREYANESEVEIEIVGLCTDVCVICNALLLRSMLPEARISIDSSCCAGTTPEKHKMALEVAKSCLIDVI